MHPSLLYHRSISTGLDTQGLYRISSAKSKMEKLCQLFEVGSERVDLSDLPPHLISSCLKLYFRQVREQHKQTNRQTNKKTNKQTDKQTNRQTCEHNVFFL